MFLEQIKPISHRGVIQQSRRGNAAVEYAIVLAMIVVAAVGTIGLIGRNMSQAFARIGNALSTGGGPGSPQAGSAAPISTVTVPSFGRAGAGSSQAAKAAPR